jgi:diguanylate cyclase (GGDEF)-like protein/PAS domain S-box-containing protein
VKSDVSAEEVFRQLADSLALNDSPDFFLNLCQRLTELLGVDHALIAEVFPELAQARTLAVWSRGQPVDNFSYPLAGSPCETVVGSSACLYPASVGSHFPDDEMLQTMRVEGYFGFPMTSQDGSAMGLIALLSDAPMVLPGVAEEVLRIAAAQAGAELGRRRAEESLLESERRLHTLMNHLPGMAYRCRNDADWTMEFVSQGARVLTGYPPEALIESQQIAFVQLIHQADRVRVNEEVQACVTAGRPYRVVYRLINAHGEVRWVWEQGQGVFSPDRSEVLLEGFISDITEQHESERVQEAVVQTATAITSRLGADFFQQLVLHLTRALDADVGFVATLQGDDEMETLARVVAGQPVENVHYRLEGSHCAEVLSKGESVGAFDPPIRIPHPRGGQPVLARSYVGRRLDSANGEPIGSLMVIYSHSTPDLNLATSVLRILAVGAAGELERQTNDRRIYQLAYVDGTTALPNRIHFMERLGSALQHAEQSGESLSLVFLDLKRFKEINDVLGHDTGDQLLAAVARRLEQACRVDEFLARLSGDEFALLVPNLGADGLPAVIERCHQCLARPVYAAGREFSLDVNIGAACYPVDAMTAADLFQCASVAMHEAKRSGGDACIFDVSIAEALNRRRALAERFARALVENRLTLHYQPQVDLVTGALVGAEVLCRWKDEHWGWVNPSEFIPLAEERGLIQELGHWVLSSASRQWAAWHSQGLRFPGRLSVNISALQFTDLSLAEEIKAMAAPVPPEAIGLELTESGFMRDPELAVEITERLRQAGFALSIDDFGTGYSSLSYLRRFAADTLKIDMSFVCDMLENQSDYTIVTTIVAMAHSLGMMTVAEGVETRAQADALTRLGCDRAQGFLYDRPLDSQRFAARWLTPE